jgi:hypothetical protein
MAQFEPAFELMMADEGLPRGGPNPAFRPSNLLNVTCGHGEKATNFGVSKSLCSSQYSHSINNIVTKFGEIAKLSVLFVKQHFSCVPIILFVRSPLQIIRMVVELVAVFVVYCTGILGALTKKCGGDKLVNSAAASVGFKRYIQVAVRACNARKERLWHTLRNSILSLQDVSISSNASLVGHKNVRVRCFAPRFGLFGHTTPSSTMV